ncbi:MAG: sigma-70 family RNA polymerase sigma factor [Deltaproteobacteria bacterium]|nr:sigma-70 family RNA polymerase sigma factor [Deltaproteobacteria bacterium]
MGAGEKPDRPAEFSEAMADPDFVARIQASDAKAFEDVVRAYLEQVFRTARGAGLDPQRSEDVVQSTFVTFMESAHGFEGRSHVRTWLFGILYKKIAEAHRQSRREQGTESIDEQMEQRFRPDGSWARPPAPMDLQIQRREVLEGIQECLDGVPTRQRMAFVLREVDGLSTKEICKILDVSVTNLGVMFYRCRNLLRECLEKKGIKGR